MKMNSNSCRMNRMFLKDKAFENYVKMFQNQVQYSCEISESVKHIEPERDNGSNITAYWDLRECQNEIVCQSKSADADIL